MFCNERMNKLELEAREAAQVRGEDGKLNSAYVAQPEINERQADYVLNEFEQYAPPRDDKTGFEVRFVNVLASNSESNRSASTALNAQIVI